MRSRRKLFVAAFALALAALAPSVADAQPSVESVADRRVRWSEEWATFRWWEYGVVAVGWGTTITSGYLLVDTPFGWHGTNDFDERIRDGARWSSSDARLEAALASDLMFYSLAAFPIVVDDMLVTWGVHRRPDVAYQLLMIDVEALGVAGMLSSITERTGRQRPYVRGCLGSSLETPCDDTGRNQSFISGHTAASFAGAGLICLHHQALPLFGARAADVLTCSTALGTAVVMGYLRLAADTHYMTDVLAAAAAGLGSGVVLPYLLHFRTAGWNDRVGFAPLAIRDAVGITFHGRLF